MPPKKPKTNKDELPESAGKTNPSSKMSAKKPKIVKDQLPESAGKKKRAPRKPKVVVVQKVPPENPKELTQEEADALMLEELSKIALQKYFDKMGNMAKQAEDPHNKYLISETKSDYETLAMILGEYLDSFVILGYRPDGEMLSMRKYHNARDKMALEKTLQHMALGQI